MSWYALYTKPQQEKKVAIGLTKIGLECYYPTIIETRQWSDRKKKVIVPLIKSYVFVNVEDSNRNIVFEVPGILRYLFWLGQPAKIRNEEIQLLKDSLSDNIKGVEIKNFQLGQIYKIQKGPFKNIEGKIDKVSSKYISISIEQMGVTISVYL